MRRILTLTLAALSFAAIASTSDARAAENNSNSNVVTHTASKGEYAEVSTNDGNGYTSVWVSKSGSPQNTTTWLSFYSSTCTWYETGYTCTSVNADGTIPNSDFDVRGQPGSADLATDTSGLPGYASVYGCDEVTQTCTFEEFPYTGGWITLSWTKSSPYSYKSHGRSESDLVNVKYINQGRYTSTSADVEGDLLGVPVASAYGSVGTAHDVSITITKNH